VRKVIDKLKLNMENGMLIIPKYIRDTFAKDVIDSFEFTVLSSDIDPQFLLLVKSANIKWDLIEKQIEEIKLKLKEMSEVVKNEK
jgi:hypothetical protein